MDPSHVSPAFQAEENVVCNFKCMTTQPFHGCHLISRSAVSDVGVYLPSSQDSFSSAVHSFPVVSKMPGATTKSTADNMTAARQKVGSPAILGANPNSYFLRDHDITNRMDMFNGMFSLYMNGRFFRQKDVKKELWTEDPTSLTELLVTKARCRHAHACLCVCLAKFCFKAFLDRKTNTAVSALTLICALSGHLFPATSAAVTVATAQAGKLHPIPGF